MPEDGEMVMMDGTEKENKSKKRCGIAASLQGQHGKDYSSCVLDEPVMGICREAVTCTASFFAIIRWSTPFS